MKKILLTSLMILTSLITIAQIFPDWVNIFASTDNRYEAAVAVAVSDSGFVYVTGTLFHTLKYTPGGTEVWHSQHTGGYANALAVDHAGNVFAAGAVDGGATDMDYAVIKFNSSGQQQWICTYAGPGDEDVVNDIALDDQGYIYVTGSSAGVSSSMWCDYATLKISPGGDTVWARRFGGNSNDRAYGIAVSDSGYVYVTGYCDGGVAGGRYNYGTIKYAANGDTLWTRFYNGAGNDDDRAYDIALDPNDNPVVTGSSWGMYDDYATVKYNAAGTRIWDKRYNGPVNSYDKAYALVTDNTGNTYVTGASGGTGINYDYATIKYNVNGVQQWVSRYNGPGNQDDYASDIAIDPNGNLYVTGYSDNPPSPNIKLPDIATVKYNNAGAEQWTSRYNGPNDYKDYGNAIAVDNDGNAYVAGHFIYYQSQDGDMVTLKYGGTGSGIQDIRIQPDVTVSPNPACGKATIISSFPLISADLTDMTGGKTSLHVQMISSLGGKYIYEIDISSFASGLYLLKATSSERTNSLKFLISN